ncbi:MAG: universal stress protein [Wenzhouxiangellaceae bacterium]|nr:universal stress protein [Wenzhouxiangellaceae bacterium]
MKRILVGIDGSDCGERALEAAAAQARANDAELLVCYVIAWSPYTFSTPEENAQRHRRREEELSVARSRILDPHIERLRESGLTVEGLARHGHPARTLLQLATEHEAGMIVIGRAGDTPLKTRIFGGTAAALVQSAPAPVLVVP